MKILRPGPDERVFELPGIVVPYLYLPSVLALDSPIDGIAFVNESNAPMLPFKRVLFVPPEPTFGEVFSCAKCGGLVHGVQWGDQFTFIQHLVCLRCHNHNQVSYIEGLRWYAADAPK